MPGFGDAILSVGDRKYDGHADCQGRWMFYRVKLLERLVPPQRRALVGHKATRICGASSGSQISGSWRYNIGVVKLHYQF